MSRSSADRLLRATLWGAAWMAGAVVIFIAAFVIAEAAPALERIGARRFATDASWHPSEGQYNMLPMFAGSMLVTLGAVLVATPLGVLTAIYCHFYAPRTLARLYRRMIELLAGIPSVVFGFWGLVTLVPLIARLEPPGTSLLAGIAIVSLMILPTIALIADSSIADVPDQYKRGASALGLTRWATVYRVVLPIGRRGIFSGIFLGTARAVGETMAVLMVCGNVVQVPESLFAPVRTLTANIALEMSYAMGDHRSALFVTGLALFLAIVVLVGAAELAGKDRAHG